MLVATHKPESDNIMVVCDNFISCLLDLACPLVFLSLCVVIIKLVCKLAMIHVLDHNYIVVLRGLATTLPGYALVNVTGKGSSFTLAKWRLLLPVHPALLPWLLRRTHSLESSARY